MRVLCGYVNCSWDMIAYHHVHKTSFERASERKNLGLKRVLSFRQMSVRHQRLAVFRLSEAMTASLL